MFLLLDKPKWPTSFDCIRKLQKLYGKKIYDCNVKIGHAWTLDPMASGLMIIAIGKSTKELWKLTWLNKTYVATIDLSKATDTWDDDAWWWRASYCDGVWKWLWRDRSKEIWTKKHMMTHEISWNSTSNEVMLAESKKRWYNFSIKSEIPTTQQILEVLKQFVTKEEFLLTPFSAKKIDGKKLYEYAREWSPILKKSPMNLKSCELISVNFPEVTVRFEVWSWTYIRSLGFELGSALGWGGILTELKREKIGEWSV